MPAHSPVYQKVSESLKRLIESDYRPGDQFLTERQVSERFGVSRPTANKVLSGLVSVGLLEFRKGWGTFVKAPAIAYDLSRLVSFTDKAQQAGKEPSTQVLTLRSMGAKLLPAVTRLALGLKLADSVWELRRLRLADQTPVILEHRYIVASLCPEIGPSDAAGSLYEYWVDRLDLSVVGAEDVIHAVPLEEPDASLLQAAAGSAAFEVTSIGFLSGDQPLWWERTLYRGDAYEFRCRLDGIHYGSTVGTLRG